jgi:hypothetical protein
MAEWDEYDDNSMNYITAVLIRTIYLYTKIFTGVYNAFSYSYKRTTYLNYNLALTPIGTIRSSAIVSSLRRIERGTYNWHQTLYPELDHH